MVVFIFAGEKFVILDLPLLYESGRAVLFLVKYVIVVYRWGHKGLLSATTGSESPRAERLDRAIQRIDRNIDWIINAKTINFEFSDPSIKSPVYLFSDPSTQLRRLMERNNFNKHDAEKRINSQMPLEEKCKRASFIIDNSSSQERTVEQVKRLHDKFSQSYAHLPLRISLFLVIVSLSWFLYAWLGQ